MLSESQSWRRLRSRSGNRHRLKNDLEYERYKLEAAREQKNAKAEQDPHSSSSALLICGNDGKGDQANRPLGARKVRFNSVIRVCLVPCRADFRGDFYLLFWERDDYQAFKEDAVRELRAHWTERHTSVKEAIFDMYQPSPDGVDHMMSELAPPPPATERIMKHVDSMGVMANLAKSAPNSNTSNTNSSSGNSNTSTVDTSNAASSSSTSTAAIITTTTGITNSNNPTKSSSSLGDNSELASNVASAAYTQPLAEDAAEAEERPLGAHSHHDRYGVVAETTFADFAGTEDRGLRAASTGGLTGHLTSDEVSPVTPMRRDQQPSERAGEGKTVVDASALFTPEMSSAPYRIRQLDSPLQTPPQPVSGDRGAAESAAPSTGGGNVRIILCEESPSSCASSFEAPILIC